MKFMSFLRFFTRRWLRGKSRQARFTPRPERTLLALEALESRDCPSAPTITLSATTLPGHNVQLSGTVTDSNPANVRVSFSGVVSGSTTTDSTGQYSFTTAAAVGLIPFAGGFRNSG